MAPHQRAIVGPLVAGFGVSFALGRAGDNRCTSLDPLLAQRAHPRRARGQPRALKGFQSPSSPAIARSAARWRANAFLPGDVIL